LEVVGKVIYLLNFFSGSYMCPATVWIFQSGGVVIKMTLLWSSSFHEHGSRATALGFHKCGSSSRALFFMVPASVHFSCINIL